jgi:hypothetical protein
MLDILFALACSEPSMIPFPGEMAGDEADQQTETGSPAGTGSDSGDTAVPADTAEDETGEPAETGSPEETGSPVDTGEPSETDEPADTSAPVDTGEEPAVDTGSVPVDTGSACTDADGDGWCSESTGGDDCNDFASAVNPGEAEVADNGVDENCDGNVETSSSSSSGSGGDTAEPADTASESADTVSETDTAETADTASAEDTGSGSSSSACTDADADGFCAEGSGGDCDDSDASVNPGASEVADDGIDQDCSGSDEETDDDGDGYSVADDCDDADASVNPSESEVVDDGVDQDCSGSDLSYADAEDQAACAAGQEACFVDVDGDGVYETVLFQDDQWSSSSLYGDDADVYATSDSCGVDGETVYSNSEGFYVLSFDGMSSCGAWVTLTITSGSSVSWWQNYSFCTDGSDTQGICVNTGGWNYLVEIDFDSTSGL